MTIQELIERQAIAEMRLGALAMLNTPADAEGQLKARAQYKIAYYAHERAERELRVAMDALSTEELMATALP